MVFEGGKTNFHERNDDGEVETTLILGQVSVCPECYEYLSLIQDLQEKPEGRTQAVIWVYWCPRCKEQQEPKLMELQERLFLNVRAMRKAQEGTA